MISKLQLDISDTINLKSFRIKDVSSYNSKIAIENGILEITSPGFSYSVGFNIEPYFDNAFNASLLKIQTAKAKKDLTDLPDGLYNIKYSIKPNDKTLVEYDYFRNVKLNVKYFQSLCELLDKRVRITKKDFENKKRELVWIKQLIDVSKYKTEDCGDPDKSIEIYNEAARLLKDFDAACNNCNVNGLRW